MCLIHPVCVSLLIGTKKWIEDNVESSEISLLAEADYVLCIDAIGEGDGLNLHVSKPPKDGSQVHVDELKWGVSGYQKSSHKIFSINLDKWLFVLWLYKSKNIP